MQKIKYDGNQIVSWDKCDWKPQEVIAPKRSMTLSDAILFGCQITGATKDLGDHVEAWKKYEGERCFTCVIGAAWVGSGRDINHLYSAKETIGSDWMSKAFNVPPSICTDTHIRYEYRKESRESIAAWLKGQGY